MTTRLSKVVSYAIAGRLPGGRKHCIVCGHRVWRFMPYKHGARDVPGLLRTLDIVGSDPDHFECPRCGAHDRERHLYLYLKASGLLDAAHGASILHFAPEKRLARILLKSGTSRYIKADLFPDAPDIQRVDMLDMEFAADSFDMVIANHVLEHVTNVAPALSEILRVLKPAGLAILQTPYSRRLHDTWEDAGIDTPQARLQAYGQEDHLRIFGRDIFDKIIAAGFESNVRWHADLLEGYDPVKYGVTPVEPFFLFRKPGQK